MDGDTANQDQQSIGTRVRRVLGPRPLLLAVAAAVLIGLLAALAYATVESEAQSRHQAEQQFDAQAKVTASLTSALFQSSLSSSATQAEHTFSTRSVSPPALDALVRASHLEYAAILDSNGNVLAASNRAPAQLAGSRLAGQEFVRRALAGQPWLGNVTHLPSGPAVVYAVPFPTRFGQRVQVEAINPALLSAFLSDTLSGTGGSTSKIGYVVDGSGYVLARSGGVASLPAASASRSAGTYVSAGVDRYYASAPLEDSAWRVIFSEPTSVVYPTLAGSRGSLLYAVLAALAVAGGACLLFFRRALVSGTRLAERNEQLKQVNATLEQKVAERTAASEQRATELARSNGELEQFASVASHDLQEPLRKIRMFGDRLATQIRERLSDEEAADLDRVQTAAARMQQMIDDLLSFARVSSGSEEFEQTDLRRVTVDVVGDLEARILELGAVVEIGDLPTVRADGIQMQQLMQNLVANALKFHRPDEPPHIRIRSRLIEVADPAPGAGADATRQHVITVEDNGIGFDEHYAERIFAAFERLHPRSTYEGTGIGLSIARKIAWRHHGEITASGRPGEGATFTLTLPDDPAGEASA